MPIALSQIGHEIEVRQDDRLIGIVWTEGQYWYASQELPWANRSLHGATSRDQAIAAEERRKAQAEADRLAREARQREAEAAAKAKAPAPVVEELKRQAETATAPHVHVPTSAPALSGSSTVATWKARITGTPAEAEPNPKMAELSVPQRAQVLTLMAAVIAGQAPITAFELNWPVLNGRAKSDKSALAIPGIEPFEQGGVRAKGRR